MVNALLKRLFVMVVGVVGVSSSAAYAQVTVPAQRPPETMSLSGPRIGITYLSPDVVTQIKEISSLPQSDDHQSDGNSKAVHEQRHGAPR